MVIDYDDFDYEIDYDEAQIAIKKVLSRYSKAELIKLVLNELDIQEEVEEYFYEEIKEHFEKEAREYHEDERLYSNDPYGYNGVSHSDFL